MSVSGAERPASLGGGEDRPGSGCAPTWQGCVVRGRGKKGHAGDLTGHKGRAGEGWEAGGAGCSLGSTHEELAGHPERPWVTMPCPQGEGGREQVGNGQERSRKLGDRFMIRCLCREDS